ncbi:MAG: hypothetical protein AAGA48_21210 [Myxococcota bacterium]
MTLNRTRVFLGVLASLLLVWSVWAFATRASYSDTFRDGDVKCPFLAMAPPPQSNLWSFARGAQANGMDLGMAVFVGTQITYYQKGLAAVLRLEAPDLHRLDQVPTISHDDRYAVHLPKLREMAAEMEVDGRLTLQQLVEMKLWVAEQTGVANPSDPSRIETALAFIRAGGDQQTWTVDTDELFTLLSGKRPTVDAVVTPGDLSRVREQAKWPRSADAN